MAGNAFGISSQVNVEAARVGFHVAFLNQLENIGPDPLEAVYTEVPSNTSLEEWDWLGDFPGFEEWKGDRKLSDIGAYKLRIENKDWASGIRVHQNNLKDDKLGLFTPLTEGLARAARLHRADLMVQLLINGFDGLAYPRVSNGLGFDGAFFFSTSHSSGSNKLTTALSAGSLATAEQMLMQMTTLDSSRPLSMRGTHLIVGPKLVDIARRLLMSTFVPNTAGTATETNPWAGRFTILTSPRLIGAYDDYWFLADLSTPIRPAIFQMREEISTSAVLGEKGGTNDSIPRFQRGELWFGAEARYNVGYFAHQTIVGSVV